MKKHFYVKFKQKLWLYLGASVMIIILSVASIVNLLGIFQFANRISTNEVLDIIATTVMLFIIAMIIIFVFSSGYSMHKESFNLHFGFFITTVYYKDILLIRTNSTKSVLLLYVKTESEKYDIIDEESGIKADIMQVHINAIDVDSFVNMIKSSNMDIIVEIIPEAQIK